MHIGFKGSALLMALLALGCSSGGSPPADARIGTAVAADTVFGGNGTPGSPDVDSGYNVEVGVHFYSDVGGTVTGVRFYKGAANVGTHTGNLWGSDGTLLSSVVFTNETASGWQDMSFGTPVQIQASTTYTVSYHTTTGFAYDADGLASETDAPPLHVPADGGVYAFGPNPTFPADSYGASDYWVDLDFSAGSTCVPACTACGQPDGCGNLCCSQSSYSVWAPSAGPTTPGAVGSFDYELGTQIVPAVAGTITDLRYYRDAADTEVHTGHLWDSGGNLLASVTFSGTSAGWQDQPLTTPVAVTAGATYTASYHTTGDFAYSAAYFASSLVTEVLTVPANGGVYGIGPSPTFPTQVYGGAS